MPQRITHLRKTVLVIVLLTLTGGSLTICHLLWRVTAQAPVSSKDGRFTVKVDGYDLKRLVERIFIEAGAVPDYLEDLSAKSVKLDLPGKTLEELLQYLGDTQGLSFERVQYDESGNRIQNSKYWKVCLLDAASVASPGEGRFRLYRDTRYHLTANNAPLRQILTTITELYDQGCQFEIRVRDYLAASGINLDMSGLKVSIKPLTFEDFSTLSPADFVSTFLASGIPSPPAPPATAAPAPEMEMWPLSFFPSSLTPIQSDGSGANGQTAKGSGEPHYIDTIVDELNNIYRDRATVTRARQHLLIYGDRSSRQEIKRLLAQIDVPWPQVQLTMWAIQISARPDSNPGKAMQEIKQRILETQLCMKAAQKQLLELIHPFKKYYWAHPTLRLMRAQGFIGSPDDPLSLNEALIYLVLHPQFQNRNLRAELMSRQYEQVLARAANQQTNWNDSLAQLISKKDFQGIQQELNDKNKMQKLISDGIFDQQKANEITAQNDGRNTLLGQIAREISEEFSEMNRPDICATYARFDQLMKTYAASPEANRRGIQEFVEAVRAFRNPGEFGSPNDDSARRLLKARTVADKLLKGAMDAYYADMNREFFTPLLKCIQDSDLTRSKGVSLVGQTRIVVTSTLEASLEPKMASYAETTRPKPLGSELLKSAQPGNAANSPKSLLLESLGAITKLEPGHAALLAALMGDIEPTYTQVAPGIAIHVRPTVLDDGGAARMKIDCRFGVQTSPLNGTVDGSGRAIRDPWQRPPADAIESHHIQTDAIVSAFDLFDISSFSVQTSHPQAPYFLPVLGRLPVIGPAFQWPRGPKEVRHESIILINTVILPRATDLAYYYIDESR